MPRTNPHGIFMTGHATHKSRDKGQNVPSVPPDSPRSDVDETSQPERRPSTAPGKRLLPSSSPQHSRPRTAWGEHSTSVTITHNDNQKVVVTFKSAKPKGSFESVLPSVTGKTAPKMYYRKPRDLADDAVNQPPPTPASIYSVKDESEKGADQTMEEMEKNLDKIKESQSAAEGKMEGGDKEATVGGGEGGDVTLAEKKDNTVPALDVEELNPDALGGINEEIKPDSTETILEKTDNNEAHEEKEGTKLEDSDNMVNNDKSKIEQRKNGQRSPVCTDDTNNEQGVKEAITSDTKSPRTEKHSKPVQESPGESLYRSNSMATPRVNSLTDKIVTNDSKISGGNEVNKDTQSQEDMKEQQSTTPVTGPEFFITKEEHEEGDVDNPATDHGDEGGVTNIHVTIVDKSREKTN